MSEHPTHLPTRSLLISAHNDIAEGVQIRDPARAQTGPDPSVHQGKGWTARGGGRGEGEGGGKFKLERVHVQLRRRCFRTDLSSQTIFQIISRAQLIVNISAQKSPSYSQTAKQFKNSANKIDCHWRILKSESRQSMCDVRPCSVQKAVYKVMLLGLSKKVWARKIRLIYS